MALCGQIIDLRGMHRRYDLDEAAAVGHVAVMKMHIAASVRARIGVQMLDPRRVERTRPTNDAVYAVSFAEQQLRQVGSILAGDAGYQGNFSGIVISG